MRQTARAPFYCLLLLGILLGGATIDTSVSVAGDAVPRPPVRLEQLHVGMTPREVRVLLGAPQHIARQFFYQCRLEQWTYEEPLPCRIAFVCRLGKEAQIQSVQAITSGKQ